jgi:hypothetical protein
MKQILTIFALVCAVLLAGFVFASCDLNADADKESGTDNSDILGTWAATYGSNNLTLQIDAGSWALSGDGSYSGRWERNGNILTLYGSGGSFFGTATLTTGTLTVEFGLSYNYGTTVQFTKGGHTSGNATLTINNQSFSDLTGVTWNGTSFGAIQIGHPVTKPVNAGTGYIFFTRATNPIIARTGAAVVVEQNGQATFTFTDNTAVVQSDDPANTGALGTLAARVAAPTGLTLTPGNSSINAQWQAVSGATQYRVYCGTAADPPSTPVTTVTGTSADITGLANGTLYYVWVKAANSQNESPFSDRASATPAVSADSIAWEGNWNLQANGRVISPPINHNAETWETLTITSGAGCTVSVTLTASSEHGYVTGMLQRWTEASPEPVTSCAYREQKAKTRFTRFRRVPIISISGIQKTALILLGTTI